jgi:hypothetical protein
MLLALASALDPEPGTSPGGHVLPPVPAAPVPVVDRGMPAFHRSARRATMFAGLAAGATAAAAWSLAITGGAVTTQSPGSPSGAVQGTRPASSGFAPASFTVLTVGIVSRAGVVQTASVPVGPRPAVSVSRVRSAESTP